MTDRRPIDALPTPSGYALTRLDAIAQWRCTKCGEPFSDKNVRTAAGRRETKISGLCENCWDAIFSEAPE